MPPLNKTSAIVVGAGVGGLSAAVLLAAAGVDVTLVERADEPGGKIRTVAVGGRAIDSGPTVCTMRAVFDELFAQAGARLDDHLTLTPARILARHAWDDGARLDLHADIDATVDAIGRLAGAADARGYRAFCERSRAIHDALERPFMNAPRTSVAGLVWRAGLAGLPGLARISPFERLWPALGSHFTDPRLRQLFGRYATYCGSSPFLAPATLMLVAHVERAGVWLVDGGMTAIARALAALAQRHGARLRFGADVAQILADGGRASGVRLADGQCLRADVVVFNGDVAALADGSLGPAAARGLRAHARRWREARQRSLSALTWSVLARSSGFPLSRHNVFFSRDYRAEFDDLVMRRHLPADPTVYVCAQDRDDAGACATDGERLLCLVNAPAQADRRWLTDQEIATCETTTFARLQRCGLRLEPLAPMRRTTPEDFAQRFPGTGGALYGPASHGWQASFRRLGARHPLPGLYLAGGSTHPGPGVPMAALSGRLAFAAIAQDRGFDVALADAGYAWWYLDAVSDDGRQALVLIAFIGSVFSPYYAAARRAGAAEPREHVAVNVALYGNGVRRWTMTERGAGALSRSASTLRIGRSALHWDGDDLVVEIDELAVPLPRRVRGHVRLTPRLPALPMQALDVAAAHRWQPIAPAARASVELQSPASSWSGDGYVDANWGVEPLERAFSSWEWSRGALPDGGRLLRYDTRRRDGTAQATNLHVRADGSFEHVPPAAVEPLRTSRWGIARSAPAGSRVLQTLEDGPFYARSLIESPWGGHAVATMHESLSLDRFASRWVQAMLPFRMPRRLV